MRLCMLALMGMLLAGCASEGGLEQGKPTFQASTSKLDSHYVACVVAQWSKISPTTHAEETPGGFRVTVSNGSTRSEELLIVLSRASGADVILHERVEVLALRAYRETAKACL
ncbi:hypothetical protein [Dyella sp. RRB7]|uniref:hypothetical protein n=1 Tax=Dyella sp. RRB7 TaxID=2919502 RepID=UPI001FA9B389|nr:hypothetical protein [Dyella sp. RRB7]